MGRPMSHVPPRRPDLCHTTGSDDMRARPLLRFPPGSSIRGSWRR